MHVYLFHNEKRYYIHSCKSSVSQPSLVSWEANQNLKYMMENNCVTCIFYQLNFKNLSHVHFENHLWFDQNNVNWEQKKAHDK